MKKLALLLAILSFGSFANTTTFNQPEKEIQVAEIKPQLNEDKSIQHISFNAAQLAQDFELTEQLLNQATASYNADLIEKLLNIYRTFLQTDPILVRFAQAQIARIKGNYHEAITQYRAILAEQPDLNPIRVELAISLFENQQNDLALEQFNKAKTVENLPNIVAQQIDSYLNALQKRTEWQFFASTYYLQENNVNNASKDPYIENRILSNLQKNQSMLPQKAHGFGYHFYAEKDFNLYGNHYVSFSNALNGKNYWDNHDYDVMTNRISLGYSNKSAVQSWRVLPFYEKRWDANHRYYWQSGVRVSYDNWFAKNWQISTALEYAKQRYYSMPSLNGFNQLLSTTVLWQISPRQYAYLGADIYREKTQLAQYTQVRQALRLGWGKEWKWGISSRLNLSFATKKYKGEAKIGVFPIGKIRQDKIYSSTLTLWKRDWHIWKITPKLQFKWYKQASNIPSLYSYTDKNVNMVFETSF
ncbi:DUF560 domain-containing protein [Haemophilus haemoglobinophilus]|nr:DUF560 domain-containing protein [Canicola haemoglobinophilus]